MSDNSVQFIRSQNIAPVNGNQNPLYEGSSVFVRVIQNKGNGNYVVSFSGQRFDVQSERNLIEGQTFHATVSTGSAGIIKLIPQLTENISQNNSLYTLLAAQGFVPDGITEKLLQFMQQSGFKIDRQIMEKARIIGLRFPGKEKKAAEIAALLLEKGIDPADEQVLSLLDLLDSSDREQRGQTSQNEQRGQTPQNDEQQGQTPQDEQRGQTPQNEQQGQTPQNEQQGQTPKNDEITNSKKTSGFLNSIFTDAEGILLGNEGTLTLLNHLKCGDRHWIILPFDWQLEKTQCHGIMRILLNLPEKNTEKLQIQCDFPMKKYNFSVYYKDSKVKEIRFCTLPPLLAPDISNEEKRLGELFSSGMNNNISVPVTYSSSALVDGICAGSEDLLLFDSKA